MEKILGASRLLVGRQWEPILGYISKTDGKKVFGCNELTSFFGINRKKECIY